MYPVSEAFLQAVQENTRRYYWTGKITTKKGIVYEFGADDIVKGRLGDLAAKVTAQLGGGNEEVIPSGMQASEFQKLSEAQVVAKVGALFTADQKKSGILASVSMAQFILESGYGKSELALGANNCFGMKKSLSGNTWGGSIWDGVSVYTKKTQEQNADGSCVTITADFRRYTLAENGVRTKVLTGDNDKVTQTICKQVGLAVNGMLLGSDVDNMNDEELAKCAESTDVFAKLTPEQKARIVSVLRENGHTVGFMGDGINDATAMKSADIGISVDTAVDVAKESADIILLEKDLNVLEDGIIEGRKTYANMIKYIKMTASSNFGNMFSVLAAGAFLPFLPMASIHLILLNLIYDLSCTAIPWDNVDEEFLRKPRTWDASSVSKFMLWIGPTSSVFDIATYVLMYFVICPMMCGGQLFHQITDPGMKLLYIAIFQAGWFVESMWSQTLVIHMIRTPKIPFVQSITATYGINLCWNWCYYTYPFHTVSKGTWRKSVYSWRLVATDSIPAGKRDNAPLREQEKLINRDLDDDIIPDGGGLTVLQLTKKYIATKTVVKHTTRAGYGTVINLLEKDPFGNKRIDKVKLSDAKGWLIKLQQEDKKAFPPSIP